MLESTQRNEIRYCQWYRTLIRNALYQRTAIKTGGISFRKDFWDRFWDERVVQLLAILPFFFSVNVTVPEDFSGKVN